jgi:1-phosphofructokinase family hexose kinase
MIVAAGLTPAWQKILSFDRLVAGEVNRARDVQACASGKVLNVGVALAHLGANAVTITLAGGRPREAIAGELTRLGVRHQLISTHWATRECTTLLDLDAGQTTELVENAGPITTEELAAFEEVVAGAAASAQFVSLTGSLPAGAPRTLYRDLMPRLGNAQVALDASGPELLAALERRPFLVKPNREELARTLGRPLTDDAQLHSAVAELHERGASWVVVSAGAGALWASGAGSCWRIQSLRVNTVNPIGCGDCLLAGIVWGLSNGQSPLEAIRVGVAAAAENAQQLLPARIDPEQVLQLAKRVIAEKLN